MFKVIKSLALKKKVKVIVIDESLALFLESVCNVI